MKNLGARWARLRQLAGLDDVRVHDLRHTAIYGHLDDAALHDAAAQTALVIANAMGFKALPDADVTMDHSERDPNQEPQSGDGFDARIDQTRAPCGPTWIDV